MKFRKTLREAFPAVPPPGIDPLIRNIDTRRSDPLLRFALADAFEEVGDLHSAATLRLPAPVAVMGGRAYAVNEVAPRSIFLGRLSDSVRSPTSDAAFEFAVVDRGERTILGKAPQLSGRSTGLAREVLSDLFAWCSDAVEHEDEFPFRTYRFSSQALRSLALFFSRGSTLPDTVNFDAVPKRPYCYVCPDVALHWGKIASRLARGLYFGLPSFFDVTHGFFNRYGCCIIDNLPHPSGWIVRMPVVVAPNKRFLNVVARPGFDLPRNHDGSPQYAVAHVANQPLPPDGYFCCYDPTWSVGFPRAHPFTDVSLIGFPFRVY